MAEREEELKSLLMKVKEESEKASLKLSMEKTKIMASSLITSWQRDGNTRPPDLPSWEICMQVRKQQLELDMEQQTGSKLGKEYIKAVYCHPAYLTSMQSTSCETLGWKKHKLESRLQGEISITSDMQMTLPLAPLAYQAALVVQNSLANVWASRDQDWIPGSGRSLGEGNGNPLQYSCLENPMDWGVWQATFHGVAKDLI